MLIISQGKLASQDVQVLKVKTANAVKKEDCWRVQVNPLNQ